jgi:hypothetical protein
MTSSEWTGDSSCAGPGRPGRPPRGPTTHTAFFPAADVLCKYYAAGCCMYGSDCRFSHVKADAPSEVRPRGPGAVDVHSLFCHRLTPAPPAGLQVLPARQLRLWRSVPVPAREAGLERGGASQAGTQVGCIAAHARPPFGGPCRDLQAAPARSGHARCRARCRAKLPPPPPPPPPSPARLQQVLGPARRATPAHRPRRRRSQQQQRPRSRRPQQRGGAPAKRGR